MIMNDKWIRRHAMQSQMIEPFVDYDQEDQTGKISYGLSSYGYDARLAGEFKVFTNTHIVDMFNNPHFASYIGSTPFPPYIDPKALDAQSFVEKEGDSCIIPPNGYVLARTVETFHIPSDILAICLGKSTYARSGILVNTTPLEPSWTGTITLEIGNCTPLPAKIYANEGICQIIFLVGDPCERSYADKQGKYMDQTGVTLPKVL